MTRPNQLLMSVVLVGEGKSFMVSKYLGRGSIVLSDTLNPAKSMLLSANWNLSGLSTIPRLAYTHKEVDGPPPVLFEVGVVMDCVVDTMFLALKLS